MTAAVPAPGNEVIITDATVGSLLTLVDRYVAAVNDRDLDGVAALHHEGFRYHRPDVPPGPEAARLFWATITAAYPDLELRLEHVAATSDGRVVAWFEFRSTTAPGTVEEPTILRSADLFVVREGRLHDQWDVIEDRYGLVARLASQPT